jgi:hypothetical protein
MNWAILQFEMGRHYAMMTNLGRYGVPCIVPLIEDVTRPGKARSAISAMRPALQNLMFIPDDETKIRIVLDRLRYAEKVWRTNDGRLLTIPDAQVQFFLEALEKREKKPKAAKKALNVAEATSKDWFDLMQRQFGLSEAIRRFGRDLSDEVAD